jgi:hypothetical protein
LLQAIRPTQQPIQPISNSQNVVASTQSSPRNTDLPHVPPSASLSNPLPPPPGLTLANSESISKSNTSNLSTPALEPVCSVSKTALLLTALKVTNKVEQEEETQEDAQEEGGDQLIVRKLLRDIHGLCGRLRIILRNLKSGEESEAPSGYYMRPGFRMSVEWTLPASIVEREGELVVGLLRYGAATNLPSIVTKSLEISGAKVITQAETGDRFYQGILPFFAPKAAGKFIYRLFDSHNRESSLQTLAASSMFSVALVDADIASNLDFVLEAFSEDAQLKAVTQLLAVVRGTKSCSNKQAECVVALNRCIEKLLDCVNSSLIILDEGQRRKKEKEERIVKPVEENVGDNNSANSNPRPAEVEEIEDEEEQKFWQSYRQACKLQIESYEILTALLECKTPWYLVSEKLKNTVRFMSSLYCPLQRRFFASHHDLMATRLVYLQFCPALRDAHSARPGVIQELDLCLRRLLPSLLPAYDFHSIRERTRERLQRTLASSGALPEGGGLVLYGSSCNNFGSAGSDVDMCLLYPKGQELDAHDKVSLIERIGTALTQMGMEQVQTRPTARIPIVQFYDPQTGIN